LRLLDHDRCHYLYLVDHRAGQWRRSTVGLVRAGATDPPRPRREESKRRRKQRRKERGWKMCFSATSSFASAAAVGSVGVATLPKIRSWREVLLGILPLLFALHQVEEGIVWLSLEGHLSPVWGRAAAWLYILFAHVLLPAYSPWAIWLVEPERKRRLWILPFLIVGSGLAIFTAWQVFSEPIAAVYRRHGIEYEDGVTGIGWYATLYVITTCAPPFLSSFPWMVSFGVLTLCSLGAAALYKRYFMTSIWCLFVALISILIYLHFLRVRRLQRTYEASAEGQ
jgi:hypothetical protein